MRMLWDGRLVNKEDYDAKPLIYNLHSARTVDIVPNNARPNRPLTQYTTPTDNDIVSLYKQYNP